VNTPLDAIEFRWDGVKKGEILLESGYIKSFPRIYFGAYYLSQLAGADKVMDSDKVDGEHASAIVTNARVKAHFPDTIANILNNHTKAVHDSLGILHSSLGGRTANDHHAQAHTLASHSSKAHSELTGVTSDLHHPQSHTLASHSTKPHSALTGVTSDQHHAQLHASEHHVDGSDLVNHNSLTGYVLNKHIDHGSLSVIAGSGLSGGGTLIASRTFNLGLLTADWDAGGYLIRALKFYSDQATGVAPFTVASTTRVANLNADLWDGYQFADYINQAIKTSSKPQFAGVNLGGATYYLGSGALASKLYTLYVNEIYGDVGGPTDPTYTFNGDNDTGMYQGGANNLCFGTGGGLRLRLTNTLAAFSLPVTVPDHGVAATDQVVNVCYGTGNPPTANTTTIGTLFVKYTA